MKFAIIISKSNELNRRSMNELNLRVATWPPIIAPILGPVSSVADCSDVEDLPVVPDDAVGKTPDVVIRGNSAVVDVIVSSVLDDVVGS